MAILRDGGDEIFVDSHGDEKDLTDFLEFVKSKMGNLKIVYNKVNAIIERMGLDKKEY